MSHASSQPSSPPVVVSTPDEMTPDWFTHVLRASGALADDARVTDAAIAPIGQGALSRSVRAELSYEPAGTGPASLVIKYATDDEGSLGLAAGMGMYVREASFYRDVAPGLDAPVPDCHLAITEADGVKLTLVLEDLTASSRPGDSMTPATEDEIDAALVALAKIQAATWDDARLAGIGWLADPTPVQAMFDALPAGVDPFLARFADHVSDAHRDLYRTLVPRAGDWVRSWTSPTVLQHGDYRVDNLMFGTTPEAPAATVIDFQTVRLGPPGVDLAYLIGTVLPTEQRRERERELVGRYHDQLLVGGVTGYDFDACWEDYRQGAIYGVVLFVGLASQVESTPRLDELMAGQSARYADMALDLDAAGAAGLS